MKWIQLICLLLHFCIDYILRDIFSNVISFMTFICARFEPWSYCCDILIGYQSCDCSFELLVLVAQPARLFKYANFISLFIFVEMYCFFTVENFALAGLNLGWPHHCLQLLFQDSYFKCVTSFNLFLHGFLYL